MKHILVIVISLVSVTSFARTKITKEVKQAAIDACKAEGRKGKDLKECIKEKLTAAAEEVKTESTPTQN